MNKQKTYYIFFTLVLVLLITFDAGAQCAMCKQAAETSLKSNPNSMVRSLNSGILYLMAVPYLMLGFIFRKQLIQLWKKFIKKSEKTTID